MKALFILGSTAVGKTDLAFYISKKLPAVLISADSIQVYKGADIISGKDNSIPTELLDIISPFKPFSVRDFVEHVRPVVKKAEDEQKIPIIVGGTGFYIDALFGKIDTIEIPPNEELRTKLDKLSVEELQHKLKKIDKNRLDAMNNSDKNNPRRLIRAIEIKNFNQLINYTNPIFRDDEVLIIGLKISMDHLRKRIKNRVDKRLQMGAFKEAKVLFNNFSNLSPQLKVANGYKELFDHLNDLSTLEEAKTRWIVADYRHAKNQMTWFKKHKNIRWFNIEENGFENKIFELIKQNLIVPGRE